MPLSELAWILAPLVVVVAGLAITFLGVRWLLNRMWIPCDELEPNDPVRRAARVSRIDDFRNHHSVEPDDAA